MKRKIYVNGTILNENPTGLGVYTKNIINKLKYKAHIKVFTPINIDDVEVIKTTKYLKPNYKKKGGMVRFLYTQFIMPFKVRGNSILYHPFQYLSLLSNKKQIITIHDFIPLHYPKVAKHQYNYYKYFMPILLKKAYKIVCISNQTKGDLLKFYNVEESKIKVVYNGYDRELFNKDNVHKEVIENLNIKYPYILMVGGGYSHKNLHSAIMAYSQIEDNKGVKLVIVGKTSPYIERLKSMVEELNLEDKVNFVGYISDDNLPSLYGKAEAFLYPTLYEGFGLPILEAWACGTLVLCSNNSSLKEVSEDGAITFNPESIEEIKTALEIVINKKEIDYIERTKLRGELLLGKYSWEKTTEEIYEVIKGI
ncbi:glycosyltransferase family 1 protein [Clostridium sp. UBA5988]|uniref:glycosyltransferase family 4 protein n=1 Tax=Clostridium sp. UBA5988 TaxID=1946369 RepID=UPI003217EE0C